MPARALTLLWGVCHGLTGCTAVAPCERGTLARPQVVLDPLPLQRALRNRVQDSRDAASIGSNTDGSGCGCY